MRKILIVAIIVFSICISFGQNSSENFSGDSQKRARQILESAVNAYGGFPGIRQARNFSMKINGISYNLFQDEIPKTDSFEPWKLERTIIYQADRQRLFHDRKVSDVNSPYVWHARQIIRNSEGFDIIFNGNWIMKMREPALSNYPEIAQLLPQNIVADALERNLSLRFLGATVVEGQRQNVLFARLSTGQMLNLFFDDETNLLTKIDSLGTTNVQGDTLTEIFYKNYRRLQKTLIPTRRIAFQNKILRYENNYTDIKLEPEIDEKLFEPNPNLIKLNIAESKTEVVKLADGVYLIRALAGGFNVMFVEFKDFVLAVEAPEENVVNGISAETIALIKKTVPSKPIKYIVPTHHHGDHSAGLRAFMAEGTTVITTKGNIDYVNRLAKASFTFAPDEYAKKPLPPQIKIVENNRMIIGDGMQSIEIHQFAPLTHVKEMLLVYVPKQKILYQSDMFNPIDPTIENIPEDDPWHGTNPANTIDLFKTIQRLGLEVETIVGSHGRVATLRDLSEAVEKIKTQK